MSASNNQRSKRFLEKKGYRVFSTEHWNPFARIRQDLFGFADLIALRRDEVLAVQTTSWGHTSTRVNKIANHENVGAVREAGIRIVVHGWKKKGSRLHVKVIDIS